jgi:aminoglycoside phosphotransferase (APT) family kinase protein
MGASGVPPPNRRQSPPVPIPPDAAASTPAEGAKSATGDDLRTRVEAHLAAAAGAAVTVASLDRLAGGACQDNYVLVARFASGPLAGERKLVLRSDARTSLPGSLDRAQEHDVIGAAVAAGVRTPAARWLAKDLVRPEGYAYFLDWVDGEAIGRRVVGSPKLATARERLASQCAAELARIHSVTPSIHPSLFGHGSGVPSTGDAAEDALTFLRKMLGTLVEPRPALELSLRWLRANPPPKRDVTLVHGDFRTGNLMVTPDGLAGVLDWEFAHWGAPAEDLAWMCLRDWRFGQLSLAAGGFAPRARLYEEYERASGQRVDPREVTYWEIMGNVRWAAASLLQGERYLTGGDSDIELVGVARRAIEMEYEALRLLEREAS